MAKPTLEEWQHRVAAFVAAHDLETEIAPRLVDLMAEAGELGKAYLQASDYGRAAPQWTDHWEEELGDVLFVLICLANQTQIPLDRALTRVMEKYARRVARQGHPGSA